MNKYNLILKTINITKTILIFLIAMLPIVYFSSGLVISVMTDNLDNEKHKGSLFVYNMVQIFLIPIIYTCILLQYSENYPQKLSNYDTIVSSKHDVVIKKPFSFYFSNNQYLIQSNYLHMICIDYKATNYVNLYDILTVFFSYIGAPMNYSFYVLFP